MDVTKMQMACNSCDGIYDSMDVRFTPACDNSCPFCIEKHGVRPRQQVSARELADATIASAIRDVLILGGEPMLFPKKMLEYIHRIRGFADHIWLTTSVPRTVWTNREEWRETLCLLDGLNVSVQDALSENGNNLKFRATLPHSRLKALEELNGEFAEKIRVSIFLGKKNITTLPELHTSIRALVKLGCWHIKICELQQCPELYLSYEAIAGERLPSPFSHGCFTHLDSLSSMFGIEVDLKRSCFMVEPSQKASMADLAKAVLKTVGLGRSENRFAVLYENAKLEKGWLHAD